MLAHINTLNSELEQEDSIDLVVPSLNSVCVWGGINCNLYTKTDENVLTGPCINKKEDYTRAFLQGAQGIFTETELIYLPWGAKLMTLECGICFLTDYLDGDNYFCIYYPEQNLDRCRTRFKLVRDVENQWEQMYQVIREHNVICKWCCWVSLLSETK